LTPVPRASRSRAGARRAAAAALAFLVVAAALIVWITRSSPPNTGYDASYPQCSGSYPSNPLFGIVGVNGGLANNANRCIGGELHWARDAPGQKRPKQPPLSLYIDTANPGAHHVADWPRGGNAPRYGACNGLLTDACSYLYGERRAVHSYHLVAALDPVSARTAPWWLDVEVNASWAGTYQLNVAALRGFIAGLRSAGATGPIGIYSTGAQWKDITGLTAQTTPAAFGGRLPDWVAGTQATLQQARRNCVSGGFTGVAPALAQYRAGPLDADLRCTAGRSRR
jgi:type II secretory pathway pseudopilin PulG